MKSLRCAIASLVVVGLTAAPAVAAACPSCVGNTQYANSQLLMLAGFTALPFTIVGVVGYFVIRAGRDDR